MQDLQRQVEVETMKKITRLIVIIACSIAMLVAGSHAYSWMGPLDTIDGPYQGGPAYHMGYPGYGQAVPWSGPSSVRYHPTYRWFGTDSEWGRPWRAYRYPVGYPGYGQGGPGMWGYPGLYGLPFPAAIYPIITDD